MILRRWNWCAQSFYGRQADQKNRDTQRNPQHFRMALGERPRVAVVRGYLLRSKGQLQIQRFGRASIEIVAEIILWRCRAIVSVDDPISRVRLRSEAEHAGNSKKGQLWCAQWLIVSV